MCVCVRACVFVYVYVYERERERVCVCACTNIYNLLLLGAGVSDDDNGLRNLFPLPGVQKPLICHEPEVRTSVKRDLLWYMNLRSAQVSKETYYGI